MLQEGNEVFDLVCWSDNFILENHKAWFVAGEYDILFQLDLNTCQCEFVTELPEFSWGGFRRNQKCIKCHNSIFCMPDLGNGIWVYEIENLKFCYIEIQHANDVPRLSILDFWQYGESIFAVSNGLNKIIEISIKEKRVKKYYDVWDQQNYKIAKSIKVGARIYGVSAVANHVYQFNMETKSLQFYELPKVKGGLRTIFFDGEKFWLSGYHKEVYVWKIDGNIVTVINSFPEKFGKYSVQGADSMFLDFETSVFDVPMFIDAIGVGDCIFFIPFQMNEIIYIDRNTYETNYFEVDDENETEFTWLRNMRQKYVVEYVRENRYLCLFSFKNRRFIEIDLNNRKVCRKRYFLGSTCVQKMARLVEQCEEEIFVDSVDMDKMIFSLKVMTMDYGQEKLLKNIGKNIFLNLTQ